MKQVQAKRAVETWRERAFAPGLDLIVEYRGKEYQLSVQLGREDYSLFYSDGAFFVVTRDRACPGVGVSHFDMRHHLHASDDPSYPVSPDPEWAIWLQDWEVEDRLGKRWERLTDRTIIKKLLAV